jgi:L-amino acid N-acyltransferase YncA
MANRNEYFLKLPEFPHTDASLNEAVLQIRPVQRADASSLAELMLDAYRGTIDDDGETFDYALAEVNAFLAGERGGQPWLMVSYLALVDTHVVGACLTGEWHKRQLPIIAYVMTSANWKKRGIGRRLLHRVLQALSEDGYPEVRAVITEGNKPSENLFLQTGFQRVAAT